MKRKKFIADYRVQLGFPSVRVLANLKVRTRTTGETTNFTQSKIYETEKSNHSLWGTLEG